MRHLAGQAAVTNGTGNRLLQADRAADAEVIRVLLAIPDFDFFTLDSNVSNPMLSAAVRTPGHM